MAQDGPKRAPGIILGDYSLSGAPFWAQLGPILAFLGPPWPFSRSSGGHLEADFGFGRLDLGVQGDQKLSFQRH